MNIASRDQSIYETVRQVSNQDLLVYAARETGLSPVQIRKDYEKVAALPGKLNFTEYVKFGMFRFDRHSSEEREAFLSNDQHWGIVHKCNTPTWSAAAEDKAVADALLRAAGVSVPHSLGVIDRSERIFPGLPKIDSEEALKATLAEVGDSRVFGKVVDGMVSFGAFRIDSFDATHVHCAGFEPMTYAAFFDEIVGSSTYLIQRELKNHPDLTPYASALATVRMVNLMGPGGVVVPFSAIKMPQGGNIADAFWREGNLACDIDVETGRIQNVARRGIEMEYLADHPEVSGLMGLQLPYWEDLKALNARAASVYAAIPYQSADIAITADGPVIVEMNYGGGFDLPQYASGKGFLVPEVRAFFEKHEVEIGVSAAAKPKKKRGFLSFGG